MEEQLQQEERKIAEQEHKREQIRQRLQEQKEKKQEQKLKELKDKQKRSNPNLLAIEYPGIEGGQNNHRSSSWGPRPAGSRLLYKEWEEKFKLKEESVTLEERKKKLEELRAMKKPINKDELEEHARKYEETR